MRRERVPKTAVGVEHAVVYLAVVGAEINFLPGGIHFVKFVREQNATIEATVEGAQLFIRTTLDRGAAEIVIPTRFGPAADGVEVSFTDFTLEILPRLFRADEG